MAVCCTETSQGRRTPTNTRQACTHQPAAPTWRPAAANACRALVSPPPPSCCAVLRFARTLWPLVAAASRCEPPAPRPRCKQPACRDGNERNWGCGFGGAVCWPPHGRLSQMGVVALASATFQRVHKGSVYGVEAWRCNRRRKGAAASWAGAAAVLVPLASAAGRRYVAAAVARNRCCDVATQSEG